MVPYLDEKDQERILRESLDVKEPVSGAGEMGQRLRALAARVVSPNILSLAVKNYGCIVKVNIIKPVKNYGCIVKGSLLPNTGGIKSGGSCCCCWRPALKESLPTHNSSSECHLVTRSENGKEGKVGYKVLCYMKLLGSFWKVLGNTAVMCIMFALLMRSKDFISVLSQKEKIDVNFLQLLQKAGMDLREKSLC
ncbi:hypothetical protein STEG23_021006 [Scotinomys teguina]